MRQRQRSNITGPNGALLEYPLSTAQFIAPLRNTLAPSAGQGPATFTRTTTASYFDNEGMLKEVRAGAARFTGARRVANLIPESEHDSAWSASGSTPPTVNAAATHLGKNCVSVTIPAGVSGYSTCRADGAPFTVTTGRTYTLSYWLAADRPLIAGEEIYVYITGSAGLCTITFNSTTTNPATQWRNYEVTSTNASGTGSDRFTVTPKTNLASPITIYVAERQCEDVTGQADQTASEYVHSGRVSPNYLAYTDDMPASVWGNINTTVTQNAIANPIDGRVNATKLQATTTSNTYFYQQTVSAGSSSGMTFSVYIKKGSGASDANRFLLYNITTSTPLLTSFINYDSGTATFGTIKDVGNGWFLHTLSVSVGVSAGDTIRVAMCFHGPSFNAGEYAYVYAPTLVRGEVVDPAYTPVGADYDPHGSGVDGVKYFSTNKDGTPISTSFLKGYKSEGATTNNIAWCRDMTQSNWVKTSMTAALTQTGIDGQANACSLLTSTSANGTCLLNFTKSAAARTFSAYVKRVTGSGTVQMTRDNGSTWTDVTALINTNGFTRVAIEGTSVTNPTCGFRLVTSGNAIAVDYCQDEAGSFASLPVLTTSSVVTRNADVLVYRGAGNLSNTVGTMFVTASADDTGTTASSTGYIVATALDSRFMYLNLSSALTNIRTYDGSTAFNSNDGFSRARGALRRALVMWNSTGSVYKYLTEGTQSIASNTFDGTFGSGVSFNVGSEPSSSTTILYGNIRDLYIWPSNFSDSVIRQLAS